MKIACSFPVLVRESLQDDYSDSDDYVVDPGTNDDAINTTTPSPMTTLEPDTKVVFIDREMTIAENSTAFLECVPSDINYENVSKWVH